MEYFIIDFIRIFDKRAYELAELSSNYSFIVNLMLLMKRDKLFTIQSTASYLALEMKKQYDK